MCDGFRQLYFWKSWISEHLLKCTCYKLSSSRSMRQIISRERAGFCRCRIIDTIRDEKLICRKVEYLNFRCKATIRHQAVLLDGLISKICKNGKKNLPTFANTPNFASDLTMLVAVVWNNNKTDTIRNGASVLAHIGMKSLKSFWTPWKMASDIWICGAVFTQWIKRQRQGGLCIPSALNPAARLAVKLPTKTSALQSSHIALLYCVLMAF